MGYEIKKNKAGLYKIKSSMSDKCLHPDKEWITEDELKKVLIEREFFNFIKSVIEIDLEFPHDYYINNKRKFIEKKVSAGSTFLLKNWNNENVIENKFREIIDRLKIKL